MSVAEDKHADDRAQKDSGQNNKEVRNKAKDKDASGENEGKAGTAPGQTESKPGTPKSSPSAKAAAPAPLPAPKSSASAAHSGGTKAGPSSEPPEAKDAKPLRSNKHTEIADRKK